MTLRIVACSSIALAVAACHPLKEQGGEFTNGVPRQETVAMAVPGQSGHALTVESGSNALLGELSEWYLTTRGVSFTVNAGALAVGTLVKLVTNHPATSVTSDSATWGPWQGPLDPVEWKVTITRVAPHQYQYKFEGRDKHNSTAAYVTVLSGTHAPGLNAQGEEMEGFGTGTFTLDWNARATLPAPDGNVGTAAYTYSHPAPGQVTTVTAKFTQVKDDKQPGRLVDADYAYMQNPGAEGSMDFLFSAPAVATDAGGKAKVKSRWLWSGAGRTDVSATATDSKLTYTLSECWDTNYLSVYKSVPLSPSASNNYGSESSCAFATALYSTL